MSQTTSRPAHTPPPVPPAGAVPQPPSPYTTRAPGPEDAPLFRRSRDDLARLQSWHTRLEEMRYRSAHTLSADDLAALGTVVGELAMMLGEPVAHAEPADTAPKK